MISCSNLHQMWVRHLILVISWLLLIKLMHPEAKSVVLNDGHQRLTLNRDLLADKNVTYKQMELDFIEIEYLYIYSDIQLTHGVTIIKAKVTNTHQTNLKQIRFILALPIEAIISNFTLESDGNLLESTIILAEEELSEKPLKGFIKQKDWGQNNSIMPNNEYEILVNLEPKEAIVLRIIYEEVLSLQRRPDALTYQYKIDIKSNVMARIQDFQLALTIQEPKMIQKPIFPNIRSQLEGSMAVLSIDPSFISIQNVTQNTTRILWSPNSTEIEKFKSAKCLGQFMLEYNVQTQPGEILIGNGYILRESIDRTKELGNLLAEQNNNSNGNSFLITPSSSNPPMHIIFVLDISISMHGNKLNQLQNGMSEILMQIDPRNYFSILTFSTKVQVWKALTNSDPLPVSAIPEFKHSAINFVKNLHVHGSTNIYLALGKALIIAKKWNTEQYKQQQQHKRRDSIIFFITDGEPTSGLINRSEILKRLTRIHNTNPASSSVQIFTLALGDEADYKFCEQISQKFNGFSRHILDDIYTAQRLEEFYHESLKATTYKMSTTHSSTVFSTEEEENEIASLNKPKLSYADFKFSYYQLEDELFKILFKMPKNDEESNEESNNPNLSLPKAQKMMIMRSNGMKTEFVNEVAALMINAASASTISMQNNNDNNNPHSSALINFSPAKLFRIKIILSEELKKLLREEIQMQISSMSNNNSSVYHYQQCNNDLMKRNTSSLICDKIKSAIKYKLVTPCTSLIIKS